MKFEANENNVLRLFCVVMFLYCSYTFWHGDHVYQTYSDQSCAAQRYRTSLVSGEWLKLSLATGKIADADRSAAAVLKLSNIASWPYWVKIASLNDDLQKTQKEYSQLVLQTYDVKTCGGAAPTPLAELK